MSSTASYRFLWPVNHARPARQRRCRIVARLAQGIVWATLLILLGKPDGKATLLAGGADHRGQGPAAPTRTTPPSMTSSSTAFASLAVAQDLYGRRCERCHGETGNGQRERANLADLPDFSRHSWQQARGDAQLRASILEGKGTRMPAFGDRLSSDQVDGLVAVVRAFDPLPPGTSEAPANDFDTQFRQLRQEWQDLRQQFLELSSR